MESCIFSPISFETCLDQWYELDNAEDLIGRLLKTDNLDIWNTEVDLLNIDKKRRRYERWGENCDCCW